MKLLPDEFLLESEVNLFLANERDKLHKLI